MAEITVPARVGCLGDVLDFLCGHMDEAGINSAGQNSIALAAEEIFVNIASYAYPSGQGDVTIRVRAEADKVTLKFLDSGKPYNPLSHKDPDTALAAEERQIGGLGIYLVRKMMDSARYQYRSGRNTLTIVKRF